MGCQPIVRAYSNEVVKSRVPSGSGATVAPESRNTAAMHQEPRNVRPMKRAMPVFTRP